MLCSYPGVIHVSCTTETTMSRSQRHPAVILQIIYRYMPHSWQMDPLTCLPQM